MKANDLSTLQAGFGNESLGSQSVFRAALQALSHPGQCVPVTHDASTPDCGNSASAAFLLAMLDADTHVWLSPSLAGSAAEMWLHFHTGCKVVLDASTAQFLWVAQDDAMPALCCLKQGTDEYPDQSATCVLDVMQLNPVTEEQGGWRLNGPGIADSTHVNVDGLPADFIAQWNDNQACFPRGIDIFLGTEDQLLGLPRTTSIRGRHSACT